MSLVDVLVKKQKLEKGDKPLFLELVKFIHFMERVLEAVFPAEHFVKFDDIEDLFSEARAAVDEITKISEAEEKYEPFPVE